MAGIQYPYAYDELESLVYIKDVSEEDRHAHEYRCPNCGAIMRPRMGKKNAPHFAHKGVESCSAETYLHKVAKDIILLRIKEGNLILRTKGTLICSNKCEVARCRASAVLEYDLSEIYDCEPKVEQTIRRGCETFIPDIVLYSSQEDYPPVNVEIFVTHSSSEKKRSLLPNILEIPVRCFEDLELLSEKYLVENKIENSADGYMVFLFNFDNIFRSTEGTPENFRDLKQDPKCLRVADTDVRTQEKVETIALNIDSFEDVSEKSKNRSNSDLLKLCWNGVGEPSVVSISSDQIGQHEEDSVYELTIEFPEGYGPEKQYLYKVFGDENPGGRFCRFCCYLYGDYGFWRCIYDSDARIDSRKECPHYDSMSSTLPGRGTPKVIESWKKPGSTTEIDAADNDCNPINGMEGVIDEGDDPSLFDFFHDGDLMN